MVNYNEAVALSLPTSKHVLSTVKKTENMKFRQSLQNGELLLQEHCSENYLKVTTCKHFTTHFYCHVQVKMWLSILLLRETSSFSFRTLVKLHYEIRLILELFCFITDLQKFNICKKTNQTHKSQHLSSPTHCSKDLEAGMTLEWDISSLKKKKPNQQLDMWYNINISRFLK